jgi:hypothetical protein
MDPRPGVKYATEYYKQTQAEYDRLREHIQQACLALAEVARTHPELYAVCYTPLRDFPKSERGQYYTVEEIMSDALAQMLSGKDLPSGMLGRWNRLFAGLSVDIEMVDQARPEPGYNHLFEEAE